MKKPLTKKLLTSISTISLSLFLLCFSSLSTFASTSELNLNQSTNTTTLLAKTVKVSKVTLNKKTATINIGSSETLIPTIAPSNTTNQNVKWKSSNKKVASVDSNGKVTGIKEGKSVITVTTLDGRKTAKCNIVVDEHSPTINVTGVSLNVNDTIFNINDNESLYATITPIDATNKSLIWESSDTSIVEVNQNGDLKGINLGTAIVTVTTVDGNKTEKCNVTVTSEPIVKVYSVGLDWGVAVINVGDNITLNADVRPSNATNKEVTWVSSDTSVATIDEKGTVTGLKEGYSIIRVKTKDRGKINDCKIVVK